MFEKQPFSPSRADIQEDLQDNYTFIPKATTPNVRRLVRLIELSNHHTILGMTDKHPLVKPWTTVVRESGWSYFYRPEVNVDSMQYTVATIGDDKGSRINIRLPKDKLSSTTIDLNVLNTTGNNKNISITDQRDDAQEDLRFPAIFARIGDKTGSIQKLIDLNALPVDKNSKYVLNLLRFIQLSANFELSDDTIKTHFAQAVELSKKAKLFDLS